MGSDNTLYVLAGLGSIIFLVVVYVAFVYGVGQEAKSKGRNRSDWILLAIFLSPIIAYVILLIMGPASTPATSGDLRACPYCAEKIQAAAIKCRFCGSNV